MKFTHTKVRHLFALTPALAAFLMAACNSSGDPAAGGASGNLTGVPSFPADPSDPSTPPPATGATVGEACVSNDPNKICLAVHFVSYKNSAGVAAANEAAAAKIIQTMNQHFSACNIGFQIETYEAVDPTKAGLSYGAQSQNELTSVRRTYGTSNDELLAVTTGPWGTSVNAWTSMPGSGPYGAVMEASIVNYGNGVIYAHEFGHYLGLDHVGDTSNLMDAIIYTSSTKLTSSQCQEARNTANSYWPAMLRQ